MDYSTMRGTNTQQHNTHVFDNIGKNMDNLVDKLCKARTKKMADILKFRRQLKGNNGVFPKSEKPRSNGHAHTAWTSKRVKKKHYALVNNHRNPNDDYPYVRNLVTGRYWSARVKDAPQPYERLRASGGKLFSSQMPNGLSPWLNIQRRLLINDIKRNSGDKMIRKK